MAPNLVHYDVVLKDAWVIDPSQSLNGRFDVAISDGKITEIAPNIPPYTTEQTLVIHGHILCPGLIDLHAHVYEWASYYGLNPDDAGVYSGVTTLVDQGSCGFRDFPDFTNTIVKQAQTDVRSFPLINRAHPQKPGLGIHGLLSPEQVDVEALIKYAKQEPDIFRGLKVHAESSTLSRWGMEVVKLAREVADKTSLPLYVHTGELFSVIEENRPNPDEVVKQTLSFMKPGDILAHCYSYKADGVFGKNITIPEHLKAAIDNGILLDVGHGIHFSLDIAQRMIAKGILPNTISSDVHGDFKTLHNDSTLDYSLCGTLSKLVAVGLDLETAIAGVTINPATVLAAENEIGTLKIGSRADITILEVVKGNWWFYDSLGQQVLAQQRFIPAWVIRSGIVIKPHCRLLRDLYTQKSQN
jgi:dihydroorotase